MHLTNSVDSAEGLLPATQLGLGIARLPGSMAEQAVADGELSAVLADVACGKLPVVVLFAGRRNLPTRVGVLLDLLGRRS